MLVWGPQFGFALWFDKLTRRLRSVKMSKGLNISMCSFKYSKNGTHICTLISISIQKFLENRDN